MNNKVTDLHDALPRKLDEEPHFALLARDTLAPGFVRLYAIVREAGPDCDAKARGMLEAILLANKARNPRPHKDKEHAWSARRRADEIEEWHRVNMLAKPQSGKLNATEIDAPARTDLVAPPEPEIFELGAWIQLTAPVHYQKFRSIKPAINCVVPEGDPIGQIATGSRGIVREINHDRSNYLVAFDGHPEQFHVVPFDRARRAGG